MNKRTRKNKGLMMSSEKFACSHQGVRRIDKHYKK